MGKVYIQMLNAMRLDSKHITEKRINPTSRTMGAKPLKEHTGRYKKDEMSKGRSCRHKKSLQRVRYKYASFIARSFVRAFFFFFSFLLFFFSYPCSHPHRDHSRQ